MNFHRWFLSSILLCAFGTAGAQCVPPLTLQGAEEMLGDELEKISAAFVDQCAASDIRMVGAGDSSFGDRLVEKWPTKYQHLRIQRELDRAIARSKGPRVKRLVLYRIVDVNGQTYKTGLITTSGDAAVDSAILAFFADMKNPGPATLDGNPVRIFYWKVVGVRRR
jgi:hypothetical protein